MLLSKTTVGGLNGFVLENNKVRTVVLQDLGARILSLIYKPTETEFAWHNPNVPVRKPTFQIEFEDVSGFFDCVPTTEACTFKGKKLPAAEVGFKPWKVIRSIKTRKAVTLKMERVCEIYPLAVRKEISIRKDEPIVRLHFILRNLSSERLEYHYSAHNTMQVTPYHRLVLPSEISKLKLGYAITDRLGKPGDEVSWPITTDKNGKTVDLSKMGNPSEGEGENLYSSKLQETWAAAVNEARKEAIAFSWTRNPLPYLLVWINNGGWRNYYHAALEPLTGRPDNLAVAVNEWKEYATLEPKGKVEWDEKIILAHNIGHVENIQNDEIVQK
jgi:galactose mutarotase-like enzyme